jgi:hypothetical protein
VASRWLRGALFGRYVLSFWNGNENQTLLGIDDQKGIQGYINRSKIRDPQGTKFMRELILK